MPNLRGCNYGSLRKASRTHERPVRQGRHGGAGRRAAGPCIRLRVQSLVDVIDAFDYEVEFLPPADRQVNCERMTTVGAVYDAGPVPRTPGQIFAPHDTPPRPTTHRQVADRQRGQGCRHGRELYALPDTITERMMRCARLDYELRVASLKMPTIVTLGG